MAVENVNPHEELKKLEEQIKSASDLAALKPLYYRLNEIIRAFPGDFDVQFTGDAIKQKLIARGTQLQQPETSPPPPPQPVAMPATPPPPPAAMPAAQPPPLQASIFDTLPPAPAELPGKPSAERPISGSTPPLEAAAAVKPPTPLPTSTRSSAPVAPPPMRPPAPVAPPPSPKGNGKPLVAVGLIAGLLVVVAVIAGVVLRTRKSDTNNAPPNPAMQVDIATTPPGAAVRVAPQQPAGGDSHDSTCTSNCKLALTAGTYQVTASLDGFEPATTAVTVTAGQPAAITLALQPQAQSVRLLTDLAQGKVVLDDFPPVDLQEGQLVLEKVTPGAHTVKVTGPNADASFTFEMAAGRLPVVRDPVNARNIIAVLVASFGKQARVATNAGPKKLLVNGQAQSDAGPAGTDVTAFQPGVNEIVVGEGADQRNMSESFGASPMLTAFLKTDVNAGTLIVSTGRDDVSVFLNGKEYRRRTQRGQLRIQTIGKVMVRVAKTGFQDEPAQTVEVKKGAEVRLQFDLKAQPQFGSLEIHGAAAGTEVAIDQKKAGTVGPDGSLSLSAIPPGDHIIELRREQYLSKRLPRPFRAGQTVALAGADVVLAAARSTVRITRNPASASITYRRGEETESHEARGNEIELPPGSYLFSASAPGFTGSTARVQLGAGENREVDFTLARERAAAPPPPKVVTSGMAEFEDAQSWKKDGDSWIHTGGGFVPYRPRPKGVFTFTVELLKGGGVFRAGQIRWCLQYLDPKNYQLFEVDRKNFSAGVVANGKRHERVKQPHELGNQKAFTIQIEVAPDRVVHKLRVGNEWKVLETLAEPGRDFTQGKFGFLIQGNDEIAISNFTFTPQ